MGVGVVVASLTITGVAVGYEYPRAAGQETVLADGVYTDRQAGRGERVYRSTCESCHAPNLEGSEEGPTLIGDEILAELMILMVDTMPEENPGGLSEEEYTDVLAYLLERNGYPAGDELTADALEKILIEL